MLKSTFFLVISQCILNQVAFYPFGWDYLFNLSRGNEIRNYVLIAYKQSVNIYTSNCTLLFYQIRKSLLLWLCWQWASETMRLYSMRAENETQSFQQGLSRIQHYIHDLDWNIELKWISLLKYITQIFNVLRGGEMENSVYLSKKFHLPRVSHYKKAKGHLAKVCFWSKPFVVEYLWHWLLQKHWNPLPQTVIIAFTLLPRKDFLKSNLYGLFTFPVDFRNGTFTVTFVIWYSWADYTA